MHGTAPPEQVRMEVYQSGIIFTELRFALEQYAAYVITGHLVPVPVPVGVKH